METVRLFALAAADYVGGHRIALIVFHGALALHAPGVLRGLNFLRSRLRQR